MKRKHYKTLERIFNRPASGNFQYLEVAGTLRGNAMNIMEVDGYRAKIEYDSKLDEFRGEILGLNGSADFYGKNPSKLRQEFKASLAVFLEVCEEKGIYPTKIYSGKFNLRIPPGLHYKIATRAKAEDKSINQLVSEVLEQLVSK
jgi:predicted HicB family RNase H-like nuclease